MMSRKQTSFWISASLGMIVACWLVWNWSTRPTVNVLLITLDTTRADHLGCYGHAAALTPALDGLAAQGVQFERAYTPAPLTLPSHASLMTGLYPPEHGLFVNGMGRLPDSLPTLAGLLTDAGYDTAAFISSFVLNSKFGLQRGFATYSEDLAPGDPTRNVLERQRDGKLVVDAALAWLDQSRRRPFFCWVHFYDAHQPYQARTEEFGDRFQSRPYDGEIAYVDRQVQRLINYLDGHRLREQTVIVVVGDHGEGLGDHVEREHGLTLYNNVLHVPCIWSGQGIAAGHRVRQPVTLVDMTPSLLDLLQHRRPARFSGRSLLPALSGEEIAGATCYSATDDPFLEHGCVPLRSLTTDFWKYIRTKDPELYDLAADPGETVNLAGQFPERVADLEAELYALEHSFRSIEASAVSLSARDRQALASLGYLGGAGSSKLDPHDARLIDVKQRLPQFNAASDARQQHEQGRSAAAVAPLRAVLQDAPEYTLASLCLADALIRLGQFGEALAELEKALDFNPDKHEIRYRIGGIFLAQHRVDHAVQQFELTLSDPPQIDELLYVGQLLTQLGQPAAARPFLERALKIDPNSNDARLSLGSAFLATRQQADAEQQFRLALQANPKSVEAHQLLIQLLGSQQRFSEALPYAAAAIRLAPANAELHFLHGTLLMELNKLPEAAREFEATLRLEPQHARAKQFLEWIRGAQPK